MSYWNIEALTGYKPKTTFWQDFSIADMFGVDAIIDTYNRAFSEWKNNCEFFTELSMVLNWKIFEHYEHNESLAKIYDKLWKQINDWAFDNLEGEDLRYYVRTTD